MSFTPPGSAAGTSSSAGVVLGSVRNGPWVAKAGDVLQDSVCVYQAEVPGGTPGEAAGNPDRITIGDWTVRRMEDGQLSAIQTASRK
jgi:hypothetical protein